MISAISSNSQLSNVVISTGNILNANNKLGSKSTEELLDGLKLALQESDDNDTPKSVELNFDRGHVLRATQELNEKLTENGRQEISIGAKIFLNRNSSDCIKKAIGTLLQILNVQHVDNVVLAYHPKSHEKSATPTTVKWNHDNTEAVNQLKDLWKSLEEFALAKQINQLGISDLDMETLRELYGSARVAPTIAQINLASCCVVPPELKEFCTQHDIQLLTHSDPEILLADDEFIIPNYSVDWTLRYQVHVRCRGVLTAKGYILGASKQTDGHSA